MNFYHLNNLRFQCNLTRQNNRYSLRYYYTFCSPQCMRHQRYIEIQYFYIYYHDDDEEVDDDDMNDLCCWSCDPMI